MGAVALQIGFAGWGGCGWVWGNPPMYTALSRRGGAGGFRPYLDSLEWAWNEVIARLLIECQALGGDGVIGINLEERDMNDGTREFIALGTAVRARSTTRPARAFTTTLGASDVAKLLHSGWVPVEVIVALSIGVRHDDWFTQRATFLSAGNIEVPGYTDLLTAVRGDARDELARRVRQAGADGAILTEEVRTSIRELEVAEGHRDHMALASLVGNAVVQMRAADPERAPKSILFLTDPKERR